MSNDGHFRSNGVGQVGVEDAAAFFHVYNSWGDEMVGCDSNRAFEDKAIGIACTSGCRDTRDSRSVLKVRGQVSKAHPEGLDSYVMV